MRHKEAMAKRKLGLKEFDAQFNTELHEILQLTETDMTIFYRQLAHVDVESAHSSTDDELMAPLLNAYYTPDELSDEYKQRLGAWRRKYSENTLPNRKEIMDKANPQYVLRNYMAQLAIDRAEEGDFSLVNDLLELLRRPYDDQPEHIEYAQKRPDWDKNRAGCSMLSCSS